MTKIAILSVSGQKGAVSYQAVTGLNQPQGRTPGEALDALTAQLPAEDEGMFIVVQNFRPDRFFSPAQQERLARLMEKWRQAQAAGRDISPEEHAELSALVDAELSGSTARGSELADELGR